jgi:hypothetical protein
MHMLGMLRLRLGSLRPTGENFTHIPGESIDAMFQRFTMIVNNMRVNVVVLPYDDHDRAIKLLHSLDHTVWSEKVEVTLESEKYETLTMDELLSKLKSSEVDRGVRAKIENPTDPHSLALMSGSRTNANMSSRHFSLSCATGVGSMGTSSPSARKPWRSSLSTSTVRGPTTSITRGMTTRARTSTSGAQRRVVVTRRRSGRWLPVQETSTQAPATLHRAQVMKMRTGTRASGQARISIACASPTKAFAHGT